MAKLVLVPLDGSAFSEQAIPVALRLAEKLEAEVQIVHVHVPRNPEVLLSDAQLGIGTVDLGAWDKERREQSREYVEEKAASLSTEHAEVRAVWLEGRFALALDAHAIGSGADLIVMTSHGHTGFNRFWLGSAADELIRTTRVPTLLMHPSSEDDEAPVVEPSFHNILIPLDGSTESTSAIAPAVMLARATGARITLFHAVSSDDLIGGPILPVLIRSIDDALDGAREHLERRAEKLRASGLEVDVAVAHGQLPARAIKEAADDHGADLVAMSTHGYGGVRRLILGSVTDKVLRNCGRPLLIQHPDD